MSSNYLPYISHQITLSRLVVGADIPLILQDPPPKVIQKTVDLRVPLRIIVEGGYVPQHGHYLSIHLLLANVAPPETKGVHDGSIWSLLPAI